MQVLDIIPPLELAGFLRGLEFRYNGEGSLERFLPNVGRNATEYSFYTGTRSAAEVGRYRAWDTEAGLSARPGFSKISGQVFPLSEKMILSEEDRLRLEMARFFQGSGLPAEIIDAVVNDAARLAERILARVEYARGQVLTTGKVTFLSTETGLVGEVDYNDTGRSITTATASPLWSNTADATPLADLRGWLEDYRDENDNDEPAVILTSKRVIDALALTDDIRNALVPSFQPNTSVVVNPALMQQYLSGWGIPPMMPYETKVLVAGTSTRVIADNLVIMLPASDIEGFGETMVGVTTEGLDLAAAAQAPVDVAQGLVGVNLKTFDPNHLWTKVAGLMVPVLKDPKRIKVATVL